MLEELLMSVVVADFSRRRFLKAAAYSGMGLACGGLFGRANAADQVSDAAKRLAADDGKALVAITLDLEMSRNFPTWEETRWDYEKGNLDEDTKRYAVEAAKLVKREGGVIHF